MNRHAQLFRDASQSRFLAILLWPAALLCVASAAAAAVPERDQRLEGYIQRVRSAAVAPERTPGSLWSPEGRFADLAVDYKARSVNDLITIRVVEQTSAQSAGSVKSSRSFDASSGLSGLFGQLGATSGLQTLFSPHSDRSLDGQALAASSSGLQTSLGGHVVAVLPNGVLVIEAQREVEMNNERQSVVVRGLVRPGDILPDNSVFSTAISNLEVELRGKGVVSDSVRPPNKLLRTVLWLLGF
ncbi:MAG TPA: flagellar basal body L-ring protein FlgH [Terriglobia bacterium]|nr:flagellar basal body L-ring protein FlgH [Terriglobia bacterium]